MSAAVHDSVVVDAPAEVVWDVIADFAAYPRWQDAFREAEVLETDADGWGTRVRFVVDAGPITATLVLGYTYTDSSMSWTLLEGQGVRRNEGTYTLEPLDDGRTRVAYELDVEPSVPVPGALRRQAARRIVQGALRDMKQRAEALA